MPSVAPATATTACHGKQGRRRPRRTATTGRRSAWPPKGREDARPAPSRKTGPAVYVSTAPLDRAGSVTQRLIEGWCRLLRVEAKRLRRLVRGMGRRASASSQTKVEDERADRGSRTLSGAGTRAAPAPGTRACRGAGWRCRSPGSAASGRSSSATSASPGEATARRVRAPRACRYGPSRGGLTPPSGRAATGVHRRNAARTELQVGRVAAARRGRRC